jgi:TolB-like protein
MLQGLAGSAALDLHFGAYRLKRQERQLIGPQGPVELGARPFDILLALLDRPHDLIDKDTLIAAAWPGLAVEENTLQVHVSALRKALDPSYIVTVHGRGYKYAGPPPETAQQVAMEGQVLDRKPVIVVLPFENISGHPAQQYFSDGITGDVTDRLMLFRFCSVIGKHSAAALRGMAPDFAAIREKLHADFVVTGSVRRSADRVRIAVRLSDAATEEGIWAERYDRPIADLFALQDEIGELVVSAIARHLEVEINVRNIARPTANLSSYEHLLQGYWHFKKLTRRGNLAARESFKRALTLDPRNAEALSFLGATYSEEWIQDFSAENAVKGEDFIGQAVALDPANARIYAAHAWALLCIGDLAGAARASERGMALNPGDPNVLVNRALPLIYEGRLEEAHALIAQARKLEPIPPLWFGEFAGIAAFVEGRYEETLAGVEPVPECAWDVMYALSCYGHLGQGERARALRAQFSALGGEPDWKLGLTREPFADPSVLDRLMNGFEIALSL